MTSHTARLYALALGVLVFFLSWALVAARPWGEQAQDPRLAALARREQRVRAETLAVRRVVERRFAVYRAALTERRRAIAAIDAAAAQARRSQLAAATSTSTATAAAPVAAAPAAAPVRTYAPAPTVAAPPPVRIVTLAPVTITRTS